MNFLNNCCFAAVEKLEVNNRPETPSGCAGWPGYDEPTPPVAEPGIPLSSLRMSTSQDNMNFELAEDPHPDLEARVEGHPYLDIFDAAFLLRHPPCQIRRLAEAGLVPAHSLRHDGQTCWKFRLSELLGWAAEVGIEISTKALHALLSVGDKPQ